MTGKGMGADEKKGSFSLGEVVLLTVSGFDGLSAAVAGGCSFGFSITGFGWSIGFTGCTDGGFETIYFSA